MVVVMVLVVVVVVEGVVVVMVVMLVEVGEELFDGLFMKLTLEVGRLPRFPTMRVGTSTSRNAPVVLN